MDAEDAQILFLRKLRYVKQLIEQDLLNYLEIPSNDNEKFWAFMKQKLTTVPQDKRMEVKINLLEIILQAQELFDRHYSQPTPPIFADEPRPMSPPAFYLPPMVPQQEVATYTDGQPLPLVPQTSRRYIEQEPFARRTPVQPPFLNYPPPYIYFDTFRDPRD